MSTKVVYIASNAHAGSTITDIMFGQSNNLVSFGQVCDVIFKDGEHVSHDVEVFWKNLIADPEYNFTQQELDAARQLYKEKALLKSIFNTKWSKQHLKTYEKVYSFMRKYAEEHGEVIVDSSKNTCHAVSLSRSDRFDMYYVHLIKSPQSFIDSINKRRLEHGKKPVIFVSYLRWASKAFANNFILKRIAKNYIKVKYDELVDQIPVIEKFIGEDLSVTAAVLNGQKMEKVHYALSGNRIINKQFQTFKPYANRQTKYNKFQTFLINILTNNPINNWLY